jgi:hypothetical protein
LWLPAGRFQVEIINKELSEEDDMIREPVFEDPGSLTSLLQRAKARLAARERLPDLELAMMIEGHRGKALPTAVSDYLTQHFRGEIRAVKGPKLQSDAAKDFRFGPADNLYRRVLPIFEYLAERQKRLVLRRRAAKSASSSQDKTPSEGALDYVIKKLNDECGLRTLSTRRSLANAISERRRKIEDRDFPDDDPNAHPTDEPDSGTSGA